MPPTPNLPNVPPCWPQPWLDGAWEIKLPAVNLLQAKWDTDIYDVNGAEQDTIISVDEPFEVCFRVQLSGALWRCICGTWHFDLCFDPCGSAPGFNLSDLVPTDALQRKDWKGCDTQCIELCYMVPAGTIPVQYWATLYEVAALFQLFCCDQPASVVGHELKGDYQFYQPGP